MCPGWLAVVNDDLCEEPLDEVEEALDGLLDDALKTGAAVRAFTRVVLGFVFKAATTGVAHSKAAEASKIVVFFFHNDTIKTHLSGDESSPDGVSLPQDSTGRE